MDLPDPAARAAAAIKDAYFNQLGSTQNFEAVCEKIIRDEYTPGASLFRGMTDEKLARMALTFADHHERDREHGEGAILREIVARWQRATEALP